MRTGHLAIGWSYARCITASSCFSAAPCRGHRAANVQSDRPAPGRPLAHTTERSTASKRTGASGGSRDEVAHPPDLPAPRESARCASTPPGRPWQFVTSCLPIIGRVSLWRCADRDGESGRDLRAHHHRIAVDEVGDPPERQPLQNGSWRWQWTSSSRIYGVCSARPLSISTPRNRHIRLTARTAASIDSPPGLTRARTGTILVK